MNGDPKTATLAGKTAWEEDQEASVPEQKTDQGGCRFRACRIKRMFQPTPQQLYNADDLKAKFAREGKDKWGMTRNESKMSTGMAVCMARFKKWSQDFAVYSSFHGLPWYCRTGSMRLKMLVMFGAILLMLSLPVICAIQLYKYIHDPTVVTKVEWKFAENLTYPNITICNSRFFDTRLLRSFNISDDLASYMLYSSDASIKQFVDFFEVELGDPYTQMLDALDDQLNDVMEKNGFKDMAELFKAVAVKCVDFVTFCEEHRRFLVAPETGYDSFPPCCGTLFDEEPFFTPVGTCYSTKIRVQETFPSTYSNIRVWLSVVDAISPVFNMNILGTDGADRDGIIWTVSHLDHPGRVIYTNPHKTATGTSSYIGLSVREEDRTGLAAECTNSDDDDFFNMFGMNKTYFNCQFVGAHFILPNCSMSVFAGVPTVDGRPPCTPGDVRAQNSTGIDANSSSTAALEALTGDLDRNFMHCPYNCKHTFYDAKVTEGRFDHRSVDKFFDENRASYELYYANESALLQFYFETFDYPKNNLEQESFFEFLSKIGGWLGFAIGGSVISFVELLCFSIYLCVVICKDLKEKF